MSWRRAPEIALAAGVIVALVGGALLFVRVNEAADRATAAAESNSHFVCTFGSVISERPLKPRKAETDREFRQRVAQTREFVRSLEAELDDCEQPTVVVIDPEARDELHRGRQERQEAHREGGDAGSPGNSPGGLGGGHGAPDLPDVDLPDPPPQQVRPAPLGALLDEVRDTVCEQAGTVCDALPPLLDG